MQLAVEDWSLALSLLVITAAILSLAHVVLSHRDSHSAAGWAALIVLIPLGGSMLYWLLGINRIHRKARTMFKSHRRPAELETPAANFNRESSSLVCLAQIGQQITAQSLLPGNTCEPFLNGDQAYPAMLQEISRAEKSISLSTYIFDNDVIGREFTNALGKAHQRGVDTRVLIDDIGSRYTFPSVIRRLRRQGVEVQRFLPTWLPGRFHYLNLRNHRKLMVVDGVTGFTGGMNIRHGHVLASSSKHQVQDIHFRIRGPVVARLQDVFAYDWMFANGQPLEGEKWYPQLEPVGRVAARAIADGPDSDFDNIRWLLLGALGCAQDSVTIVTPYFVPDQSLMVALGVAALRGVSVRIVLPLENNLALVHWASQTAIQQVLTKGCHVYLTPPPFDHSKLMIVDDEWVFVGSANWDARSLRLNFELNLECYDQQLASALLHIVSEKLQSARQVTSEELDNRALWKKLRDGTCRLIDSYL